MKTKILFIVLVLLAGLSAQAQLFGPPGDLPKSYWQDLERSNKKKVREAIKERKAYQKANSKDFDFFLNPIPLPVPEGRILSGPAWHCEYLESSENEQRLLDLAKAKFVMAIMDTGEPDYEKVRKYIYPSHISKSYTGEPVLDGHSHATHIGGSYVFRDQIDETGVLAGLAEAGFFYNAYYKVCTNGGGCSHTWIAQGIRDFISYYESELKPKNIRAGISMSLGGGNPNQRVIDAVNAALDAGIFVFASSGNNGRADISFPAEIEGIKAIGAHGRNGNKASFSNWGNETEDLYIIGPGVSIYSTCKGESKCIMSGTSMGNPIANAMVAAVAICKPEWNNKQVIDYVAKHATDLGEAGYDRQYGYGTPKLGALLDNLNESPAEPTCSDGIKNGDETGVDCGGSCPPCEVPPPPPGKIFPERIVQVKLQGHWRAAWSEMGSNATSVMEIDGLLGYEYGGQPYVAIQKPNISAWNWLDVTEFIIRTKSNKDAAIVATEMRTLINSLWSGGRGVAMAVPADFDKAGRLVAYFTDLLADRFYGGFDITVESITFSDAQGHTLTYDSSEMEQWPRGSNPVSYDFYLEIGEDDLVHYTPATEKEIKNFWQVDAVWYEDIEYTIGGGMLPAYNFTMPYSFGVHTTYVQSGRKPSRKQIAEKAPFGKDWQLGEVLSIKTYKPKK